MMGDSTSRKRLKKKVLDRWENEGGRLCDDPTTAPESSSRGRRDRKGSTLQDEASTARNENPPVGTSRPKKK